MKLKIICSAFIAFFSLLIITSCTSEEDVIENSKTVYLDLPATPYRYGQSNLAIDDNIATLGRVLFYDTRLSLNNSIACAGCHKQSNGFADKVALSAGYQNHLTTRNSPAVQNVATNNFFGSGTHLFWDGRAPFLNSMVFTPMLNHVEMGMSDIASVVEKISSTGYYPELFAKAYGSAEITADKIGEAIGNFISSISSTNTKFDASLNGMAQLNADEKEGEDLFFNKYNCNSCHQTQVPNGYEMGGTFANIGLETEYTDKGRESVTNSSLDNGKFKIPDLRNVAVTGPYMHDGRFSTLGEVIDHYSHGIVDHPSLDMRLRNLTTSSPMKFNITEHEKTSIIAFLNTLTDYSLLTDKRFSSPFKSR